VTYNKFSLKAAFELASPPTWVAAVMPSIVGGALATVALFPGLVGQSIELAACIRATAAWLLVLVTAVLLQAAVNTLNDYVDFRSGLDTAESILDETDASIVYNQINPKSALRFAGGLMGCATVTGVEAVVLSGWVLLIFGMLAGVTVLAYSAGPKPISFLPLGEAISGLAMGFFITSAAYFAITQEFSFWVLAACVPPIVTIALIMQTNNTCDIERDIEAGRHTLPILLGRRRSQGLAGVLAWGTLVWMALLSLLLWPIGIVIAFGAAIVLRGRLARIVAGPYDLVNRRAMMGNITAFCRWVNAAWALAILSGIVVGGLL
jgi:1,4-dihydroxy-2-naphthoate octaprenyltransferase